MTLRNLSHVVCHFTCNGMQGRIGSALMENKLRVRIESNLPTVYVILWVTELEDGKKSSSVGGSVYLTLQYLQCIFCFISFLGFKLVYAAITLTFQHPLKKIHFTASAIYSICLL